MSKRKKETRYCDNGCGYKLPDEYASNETTCGACLNEMDDLILFSNLQLTENGETNENLLSDR